MVIFKNLNFPQWMDPFLQMDTYESKRKCKIHIHKYENVFCCVCMEEPICEICWKNSTKHQNHQILQVYAASRRTGIDANEMAKFWDVSEIQKYRINNKFVLFLNSYAEVGSEEKNKQSDKCETCNKKLMESKNRFCSIACKKTNVQLFVQEVPMEIIEEKRGGVTMRKRRRKGIPRRAPFF